MLDGWTWFREIKVTVTKPNLTSGALPPSDDELIRLRVTPSTEYCIIPELEGGKCCHSWGMEFSQFVADCFTLRTPWLECPAVTKNLKKLSALPLNSAIGSATDPLRAGHSFVGGTTCNLFSALVECALETGR